MNVVDTVATIDLEPWRTSADEKTAIALVESLKGTGFAYITGHEVPAQTVSDAFDAAHSFFNQDPQQLDALHYRHAMNYHGYVPPGITPAAYHELYDVGMDIPSGYRGPGDVLRSTPNLWPPGLPGFRPAIERYQAAMRGLADTVLGAVAVGLSLPADFFAVRCAEPHAQLRLLHYLQVPDTGEDVYSVGRHSDYETVTILAQDNAGGLKVWGPQEEWIDVPPLEGAFIVNAGDMMPRWTNGLLPAAQHRVSSPVAGDRYAIAFFYGTSYDVVIEPALPPAGKDTEVYEPITTGAYFYKRFSEEGI
jgi:isopenicillin N synthase-like dioxygenase